MRTVVIETGRDGKKHQTTVGQDTLVIGTGESQIRVLSLDTSGYAAVFMGRNIRVRGENRIKSSEMVFPGDRTLCDMVHPRTTNSSVSIKVIT